MRGWILYMVVLCFVSLYAQARAGGIEELESNSEYMALLEQDSVVSANERLLIAELAVNRKSYSAESADAAAVRQKIAEIEQSLIDISVQKNAISSKLTTMKQSWMIDYMANKTNSAEGDSVKSEDVVRIVQSSYAQSCLTAMDLKNLTSAELGDKRVGAMVGGYISNYDELARLCVEYDSAPSKSAADSIVARFEYVDSLNIIVARNIAKEWGGVVDNKSFTYAMLIEKSADNSLLFARDEELKIKSARIVDSLRLKSISEELLNYYASRLSIVELEYALASALKLPRAVDSLRVVRDSLRIVEFNYPKLSIEDRSFIEYEPIKFSTKAVYDGSNLIPNGKIYESGVIYRLLVGSFKTRQPATLFRGAYPIYIFKNDAGLLSYYLGGYRTKAEAERAKDMLLKRGFRRPEVVEWCNGVAPNHTGRSQSSTAKYRVEIEGVTELTAQHRSTIESQGGGKELSKVGGSTFVVGMFDSLKSAQNLVDSLKRVDADLGVSVVVVR